VYYTTVILQFVGLKKSKRDFSAKWIREIVQQQHKEINVPTLLSLKASSDGPKGGFRGFMLFLVLEWPQSTHPSLPRKLVVKSSHQNFTTVKETIMLGGSREGLFYKEIKKNDEEFPLLPRIYYAKGSAFFGEFTVIMEDLSETTIPGSHMVGNQCWGAVDIPREMQEDPVYFFESVFCRTADIHAKYWRDENLLKLDWLKATQWLQGRDRGRWEFAMICAKRRWRKVMKAVKSGATKVKWSEDVIQAMEKSLKQTSWSNYRRNFDIKANNTPFTLCHGDYHAANMLWCGKKNPKQLLYFVDWSEVGVFCPFTEIAQFLISNATVEVRRQNEKRIFRTYYDRLVEKGINKEVFPFSDCWLRYQRGGMERWLQMLSLLADMSLSNPSSLPDQSISWFHNQVAEFIVDHGKVEPGPLMSAYCL